MAALFTNVPPGTYHLRADHDAGIPDGVDVKVTASGPTNVTVRLKWPSVAPIVVRSLQGTLRGPSYFNGQSQPSLSLDLTEAISGRLVKSIQTANNGEFNFEAAPSGLYFLTLKPSGLVAWSGEQITGQIAVAVDQSAPAHYLDIDLGWTSCGLWFLDQNHCAQQDLHIARLSGAILDVNGAAIRDATILLLDHAHKPIQQWHSDNAGKFASLNSLAGTYELVVSAPGFTPLRRNVDFQPTSDSALHSSLTVQLGLGGVCSSAESR